MRGWKGKMTREAKVGVTVDAGSSDACGASGKSSTAALHQRATPKNAKSGKGEKGSQAGGQPGSSALQAQRNRRMYDTDSRI